MVKNLDTPCARDRSCGAKVRGGKGEKRREREGEKKDLEIKERSGLRKIGEKNKKNR